MRHDQRYFLVQIARLKADDGLGRGKYFVCSRAHNSIPRLFQYKLQSKLDDTLETMLADMGTVLYDKLLSILEYTLSRLARYDEGNPLGALLSMAPKPNSIFNKMKTFVSDQPPPPPPPAANNAAAGGKAGANAQAKEVHLGHSYVQFLRSSSEQLQQVVTDEVWVNNLFEVCKRGDRTRKVGRVFVALVREPNEDVKRLAHRAPATIAFLLSADEFVVYCQGEACDTRMRQLMRNSRIRFQKIYSDFELHGIDESLLDSKIYQSVLRRVQLEETNSALNDTGGGGGHSMVGNATSAVSNVGSLVEGAGAKVFSLFK